MNNILYHSGQEIRGNDHITYHGDPGVVLFLARIRADDATINWYLDKFQEGGLMIETPNFGKVFIEAGDVDEKLVFISRMK
jgi:hypothetical protein